MTTRGRALVLGAPGQVGRAAAAALAGDGWEVLAGARGPHPWPEGVTGVRVDREDDASLAAAVGEGVDVLVDCVAYTAEHARQLTALAGRVGSAVVVSSLSVYADDRGRTLDEATGADDFPVLPVPVREDQPTVPAGPETYSTRKVAMEQVLLAADAGLPVTVLRPGAITGPHTGHPRELWFVQRALDRRGVQVLTHAGLSRFHTTSTGNLAELVRLAAARPGTRVLNAVDPVAPTTAEIGAAINALLDHSPQEVLLDGAPHPVVGDSPWGVPRPFVLDTAAAERELGYRAPTTYEQALPAAVEWLVAALAGRDWREVFPFFRRVYGEQSFDYALEDAWLAEHGHGASLRPISEVLDEVDAQQGGRVGLDTAVADLDEERSAR